MKVKHKFTVILLPDDGEYQVIFPHYPNCVTHGKTVEDALQNAREAIELLLEYEAEQVMGPVPPNVHPSYVVVGEIEAKVPETLIAKEAMRT